MWKKITWTKKKTTSWPSKITFEQAHKNSVEILSYTAIYMAIKNYVPVYFAMLTIQSFSNCTRLERTTEKPGDIWSLTLRMLNNVNIDIIYTHTQIKCEEIMKIILDSPFKPIANTKIISDIYHIAYRI